MTGSTPTAPRVVIIDFEAWECFTTLRAALRRVGVRAPRLSRRGGGPRAQLLGLWDLMATGTDPDDRRMTEDELAGADLSGLLAPPTLDLQGPEDAVAGLRPSLPPSGAAALLRTPDGTLGLSLYDKLAMTELAAGRGIPVPTSSVSPSGLGLPLVVKKRTGSGGQAVRVVHTEQELSATLRAFDPDDEGLVFCQAFVPGHVVNYGGVAQDGALLAGSTYEAIPAPHDPLGPSVSVRLLSDERLERDVVDLVRALRYTGFFCIDYVVPPGGPALLIDFNPRVFGSWLALEQAGVPLLQSYLAVLGRRSAPPATSSSVGRVQRVALRPRVEAADYRELVLEGRRVIATLRDATGVTGGRLALAFGVRTVLVLLRDAARLALRSRPTRPASAGSPLVEDSVSRPADAGPG